ncbi:hypothetical protein C9J27_02540 [Photobacterium kishitanii]|uniref:Uncharacterized protein n=1 Tax=Photobacterium kishitanii TaxID=318456 RepID=A0A2T3KMF0_9GAMM|nr:hypothetical protein C9J27_02540 [Photobacterium kishitanii]
MSNTLRKSINSVGNLEIVKEKTSNFDAKRKKEIQNRMIRAKNSQPIKDLKAGNIDVDNILSIR